MGPLRGRAGRPWLPFEEGRERRSQLAIGHAKLLKFNTKQQLNTVVPGLGGILHPLHGGLALGRSARRQAFPAVPLTSLPPLPGAAGPKHACRREAFAHNGHPWWPRMRSD